MSQSGLAKSLSEFSSIFTSNSGSATPENKVINILGSLGVSTEASGNTLTIYLNGQVPHYTNVSTTPYVVVSSDYFISCDTSSSLLTIKLPDAPTSNKMFIIKDRTGDANARNITVTTVGGLVEIDGSTSVILSNNYQSVNFIFNGTSYEVF